VTVAAADRGHRGLPPIAFDLSRLISRAARRTPTGIDRVELAYARHLLGTTVDLCFAASTPWGRLALLPGPGAREFVETVDAVWRGDPVRRMLQHLANRLRIGPGLRGPGALYRRLRAAPARPVYLLASHHHLEQEAAIGRLKERAGARFVCVIHDLIPIEFPNYVRPGQDRRHRRRMATAAALADAVIVASRATREALQPYLDRAHRAPAVLVAPFGATLPEPPASAPATGPPYFVCVGTIEPRKNQLMLLNVWRQIAAEAGDAAPRLVLVGRRGWGADSAFKRLDRLGLRDLVTRRDDASDTEVAGLLRGTRALLLPTFAEGFGLPLVEALALGVPVLCSGIPALREHGGEVPDYLDPHDAASWRQAIFDYTPDRSARREAQLQRLRHRRPPRWQSHFDAVERLLVELTVRSD
jgi:glycosyltransferase involved in cell wall biosynthesis